MDTNIISTNQTILLIDDEHLVRVAVETSLQTENYRVIPAESGQAAIEAIQKHGDSIDLLLLDYGLPDISGFEILQFMYDSNLAIPTILCSGRIVDVNRLPISPIGTLLKPYTIDQLLSVLQDAFCKSTDA